MTPTEVKSLIFFDGYVYPAYIPQGLTHRMWANMERARMNGATWGDFAVYTRQEMDEILDQRGSKTALPIASSVPISCEYIERAVPCAAPCNEQDVIPPKKASKTLRDKLDKFLTPTRALCLGCVTYCVNSKPPENWSAADRKRYCCLGCRDSSGKKHADRCQKHKPF